MPDWLYRLLEDEEKQHLENAPSEILDILGKLLEQDRDVVTAYLCHSGVRYIGKVKVKFRDEGDNFCGYHNIQMLVSHAIVTKAQGLEIFADAIPTIWGIQDLIEEAWDQGFNESGRIQTGGIKGSRKHIGTPEVCRVFLIAGCCKGSAWRLKATVGGSGTSWTDNSYTYRPKHYSVT